MKRFLSGDEAFAEGVRLARPQVISAYPITPQTVVVERLSEMVEDGSLAAEYVHVESEHSALSCAIGASAAGAGAAPPGMVCAACSGGCGASVFAKSASLIRLLIRFFFPVAAFTSTAPSRVIFCVTFSRALYCFMCLSLQSAPLQGRNTRRLSQCLYNACQAALRLPPSCRCRKRGQAQRRLSDSPP